MRICVFSFNRGRFLQHCIESIEARVPRCPISIYDDGSDDPSTLEVLSTLEYRHRVVRHIGGQAGEGKHGGLYRNMQRAVEEQPPGEIVCFVQDDMQVVRSVDPEELDAIADTLESFAPRFLHPAFLKACNRESDARDIRYDAEAGGYYSDRFDRSAGAFYSDVFIASVDHLRAVEWTFAERESLNEAQARQKMAQMFILRNPFFAWLPRVPAWRGRTRTIALRAAERRRVTGSIRSSRCPSRAGPDSWSGIQVNSRLPRTFLRRRTDQSSRPGLTIPSRAAVG
ncbi:MAG: glycosyltransferase [Gammaproteobacteria bacterium]|nr:glycosyltransferase [Gammaproteobacteria bacterium]